MGIGIEKLFDSELNSEIEELNREKAGIENYRKKAVRAQKFLFIGIITLFYLALTIYTTGFFLLCLPLYLFKIRDIWINYEDGRLKKKRENYEKRVSRYKYSVMGKIVKDIDSSLQFQFDNSKEITGVLCEDILVKKGYCCSCNALIRGIAADKYFAAGNFCFENDRSEIPALLRGIILTLDLTESIEESWQFIPNMTDSNEIKIEQFIELEGFKKVETVNSKIKKVYSAYTNGEKELPEFQAELIDGITEKAGAPLYILLKKARLTAVIISDEKEIFTSHEKLMKYEYLSKNYLLIKEITEILNRIV